VFEVIMDVFHMETPFATPSNYIAGLYLPIPGMPQNQAL
jgi:hypothetical protein